MKGASEQGREKTYFFVFRKPSWASSCFPQPPLFTRSHTKQQGAEEKRNMEEGREREYMEDILRRISGIAVLWEGCSLARRRMQSQRRAGGEIGKSADGKGWREPNKLPPKIRACFRYGEEERATWGERTADESSLLLVPHSSPFSFDISHNRLVTLRMFLNP